MGRTPTGDKTLLQVDDWCSYLIDCPVSPLCAVKLRVSTDFGVEDAIVMRDADGEEGSASLGLCGLIRRV
jgi:hypothetical protein